MPTIDEIAPDVYRISTFVPEADLQFAQFLVRDDEPLLFHTGPRMMFPLVRDAVATLVDPASLRCPDLAPQNVDVAAVRESDVLERHRETLLAFQQGPLANYLPYTTETSRVLQRLADAKPRVLATMHGTAYRGDGAAALRGI